MFTLFHRAAHCPLAIVEACTHPLSDVADHLERGVCLRIATSRPRSRKAARCRAGLTIVVLMPVRGKHKKQSPARRCWWGGKFPAAQPSLDPGGSFKFVADLALNQAWGGRTDEPLRANLQTKKKERQRESEREREREREGGREGEGERERERERKIERRKERRRDRERERENREREREGERQRERGGERDEEREGEREREQEPLVLRAP